MRWITRSHVHVDRVACPWLITRFIDSDAEFLFVPKSAVMAVADREGAIPFDAPGATLNHEGDLCTFDVIIRNYGLADRALLRLAQIVNAADTGRFDNDPLAPASRPSPSATACAIPTTSRTSSASSRSTMRFTPGAAWRRPRKNC